MRQKTVGKPVRGQPKPPPPLPPQWLPKVAGPKWGPAEMVRQNDPAISHMTGGGGGDPPLFK